MSKIQIPAEYKAFGISSRHLPMAKTTARCLTIC